MFGTTQRSWYLMAAPPVREPPKTLVFVRALRAKPRLAAHRLVNCIYVDPRASGGASEACHRVSICGIGDG